MKKLIALVFFFILYGNKISAQNNEDTFFSDSSGVVSENELFKNRILPGKAVERVLLDRIQKAERRNEPLLQGKASANLAVLLARQGKTDSASVWFQRATDAFIKANAFKGAAASQSANGHLYARTGNNDSAAASFRRAASLNHLAQNNDGEIRSLLALSKALEDDDKHKESLISYRQAADLLSKSSNAVLATDVYLHLAEELIHNGNEGDALTYLEKALPLITNDNHTKAAVYRDIGIVYYKKSEYEKANEYFNKSLSTDYKLPALRMLRDTYLKLYASNRISGNKKKEVYYSELYKKMKDSVEWVLNSRVLSPDSFTLELKEKEFVNNLISKFKSMDEETNRNSLEFSQRLTEAELERLKTEEVLARMSQERMNDEVADQEREDKLNELEKAQAEQELALSNKQLEQERQLRLIYILLGGVLLVSIILLLMYNRFRLKRKSHDALNQAYSELSGAHKKLKDTQEQLIRSEKMASLGQMTAGIAHEIQNPLNFVLNFSESSAELLTELQEAKNDEDRLDLIRNLKMNLDKIAEHGKRADSIVKNMLQHSRVNKSEKTPTNLNKLADEYLQLAFHGMRAKDSTFSCVLEKELDENFPVLELVQQDISRVFLNLFNNALYAVNERAKREGKDYTPTIRIGSEVYGTNAIITISDNGTGIPKKLQEKVFEPFFTTKPTGQGTGLGLSLSFEIIKSHGAKMTMESEEGNGTVVRLTFRIPVGE